MSTSFRALHTGICPGITKHGPCEKRSCVWGPGGFVSQGKCPQLNISQLVMHNLWSSLDGVRAVQQGDMASALRAIYVWHISDLTCMLLQSMTLEPLEAEGGMHGK